MGDEATCSTPISIPIIQRYLTKQRFDHLIDVVFSSHIQSNPQKFKYCTTPDCTQIYQCDTGKQFHKCPSCFSEICSSCNEEAHEGMTCEERRIQSNPAEQERLTDEWIQSNNIKPCPSCNILTEKAGGCNHITCTKCKKHFCWICMGIFEEGTIYRHMSQAHGGWAVPDPAARNLTPAAPVPAPEPTPILGFRELQEHILAERQIEAAIIRREAAIRRMAEEERRRRETERRWALEAQERRRQEETRLAAEVARREAEKKKGGSFCAIM
jgi:hypothetical protein